MNTDPFTLLAARQITPALPDDMVANLETNIRLLDGRSFSSPVATGMPMDYADGAFRGHQSSNATFFCSKLATLTLQLTGLLSQSIISNSTLPGDYGEKCTNGKITLTVPYTFGAEIPFTPSAPTTSPS